MSQTLQALEARVGGQLFARTSRRVRLTPLGEALQRRMAPAYARVKRAFVETREEATGLAGPVRIGSYSPIHYGAHLLEIVRTFAERHPDAASSPPTPDWVVTSSTGSAATSSTCWR